MPANLVRNGAPSGLERLLRNFSPDRMIFQSEMGGTMDALAAVEIVMREAALFAACGFLLLGASDLAVDLIWIGLRLTGRAGGAAGPCLGADGRAGWPIFIPAWDEAAVIGRDAGARPRRVRRGRLRPLCRLLSQRPGDDRRGARRRVDPGCGSVIGPAPGPTSKADCLNRIWERMIEDEAAGGDPVQGGGASRRRGRRPFGGARLFDALIERYDLVQLPVRAADRPAIAVRRPAIISTSSARRTARSWWSARRSARACPRPGSAARSAATRSRRSRPRRGAPFDPDSLTEDYELGLRLQAMGRRAAFVRTTRSDGRRVVATREYFPATLDAAVAQKARWMTGIALAGWDRLGWSGGLAERWMRLRDRQSLLAALVLAAAYLALVLWRPAGRGVAGADRALDRPSRPLLTLLLAINFGAAALAAGDALRLRRPRLWLARGAARRCRARSPRNIIAMMAARRALARYVFACSAPAPSTWDKTAHAFPRHLPAE